MKRPSLPSNSNLRRAHNSEVLKYLREDHSAYLDKDEYGQPHSFSSQKPLCKDRTAIKKIYREPLHPKLDHAEKISTQQQTESHGPHLKKVS